LRAWRFGAMKKKSEKNYASRKAAKIAKVEGVSSSQSDRCFCFLWTRVSSGYKWQKTREKQKDPTS